jgi:O-antigen ligase
MKYFQKTGNFSEAYVPAGPQHGQWTWTAPLFVLLGVVATVGIVAVMERFGGRSSILELLFLPAGLLLLGIGLVRSMGRVRSLIARLTWWHVLWALIFASALVFRQRSVNQIDSNLFDAWAIYRIALDFIVGTILFTRLALRRPPFWGSMFRGYLGVMTLFALICIVSTVWSVYPSWTLFKSMEYLMALGLLAAILETVTSVSDFRSLFNWTWALYGFLLFTVWIGAFLWPQEALYPIGLPQDALMGVRLSGVMPAQSSEGVGIFAAAIGLVCLCRLFPLVPSRRGSRWYFPLLGASIITMVLSQTRMAIGGFLLGAFLILFLSKRLRLGAVMTFLVGPLLLLTGVGSVLWAFLKRGENYQALSTLSSRLVWWKFAWDKFLERPLTGFGAYAGERFAVMAKLGLGSTSSLHSDYLGIIVGSGIWGLLPFLAALIGVWWCLISFIRSSHGTGPERQLVYEAIAVFALLTINSVFVPMFSWQAPLYFLVILGYAEFLRRSRLRENPRSVRVIRQTVPELEAVPSGK